MGVGIHYHPNPSAATSQLCPSPKWHLEWSRDQLEACLCPGAHKEQDMESHMSGQWSLGAPSVPGLGQAQYACSPTPL